MAPGLFLGIDTGGTFSDGVLLDPERRKIVQSCKVLTTHQDLRVCIGQVLERLLPSGAAEAVRLVSLSTTLATNAIVEGKSRPVALVLLGYDPQLVYKYDFQHQFGTSCFRFVSGGMDLQGNEQGPLDEVGLSGLVDGLRGKVEAFAVSSYAGVLNGSHEERAAEILKAHSGLPVVLGHHLTSRLDSIRRATTATLNAGLLSTTLDFMQAVREMLAQRGINCPLSIVRGDGSLVSAEFAAHRPVEIVHSGPATSAIGGLYLSGKDAALVVDIGGTTTDLSLLSNGRVLLDGGSATVGGYPTSVQTIRSRSFGLGGDSQIHFDARGQLSLGPGRVIPLSYLGYAYPEVKHDLEAWLAAAPEKFYSDRIEYWLLRREPLQPFNDPRTNRALELLRGGPRRMAWLVKQAGAKSPVQVDGERLAREDIISWAGLTPTDLLHVTGEFTPWDADLARQVVEASARVAGVTVNEWIERVRQAMTRMIVAEILQFITGQPVPEAIDGKNGSLGRWMFEQTLARSDPFLSCQLQLSVPIIGVGAPARAFLPAVGEALHVPVIFPDHYDVANAVGTVVGNVLVRKNAEVLPLVNGTVVTGYVASLNGQQQRFESQEEARLYARQAVCEQARGEAIAAGASDPTVELEEQALIGGMVSLIAQAVGKPGLDGQGLAG